MLPNSYVIKRHLLLTLCFIGAICTQDGRDDSLRNPAVKPGMIPMTGKMSPWDPLQPEKQLSAAVEAVPKLGHACIIQQEGRQHGG